MEQIQLNFETQKQAFLDAVQAKDKLAASSAFDFILKVSGKGKQAVLSEMAESAISLPSRESGLFGIYMLLSKCKGEAESWAVLQKAVPEFRSSIKPAEDLAHFRLSPQECLEFQGLLLPLFSSRNSILGNRAQMIYQLVSTASESSKIESKDYSFEKYMLKGVVPGAPKHGSVSQAKAASLVFMDPNTVPARVFNIRESAIPQFLRTVYGKYGNDTERLLQSLEYLAQGLSEQLSFNGRPNPDIGRKYIETFPPEMLPNKDGDIKNIDQWYDLFGDMGQEELKQAVNNFVSLCRQGQLREAFSNVVPEYGVAFAEAASSVREQSLLALEVPIDFQLWGSGFISIRGGFLRGKKFSFVAGEGFKETTLASIDAWAGKTFVVRAEDKILVAMGITAREAELGNLGGVSKEDLVLKIHTAYSSKTGERIGLGQIDASFERDISGKGQRLGVHLDSREFHAGRGFFIKGGASYLGVREGKGFLKTSGRNISGSEHDLLGGTGGDVYSLDAALIKKMPGTLKELSAAFGNSWSYWSVSGEYHRFDHSSSPHAKFGAKIDAGKDILIIISGEYGKTSDGNYARMGLGLQVK